MDTLRLLQQKFPTLPRSYFKLLSKLDGWEGFVGDDYVVLFGAAGALVATDEYQLPVYRPGYFALGSNGGGELIVCELQGSESRPAYHLPAIGMSDATPIEIAPTIEIFAQSVLAAAAGDA
jgi:hypothetical protein